MKGPIEREPERQPPSVNGSRLAVILALSSAICFAVVASAKEPQVECRYGAPVHFREGILIYPDFSLRFEDRKEFVQSGSRPPWVNYVFHFHHGNFVGDDFTFTSEHRANARRFDDNGRVYVAEMFYSTAGLPMNSRVSHTALPDDELIVWDESSAAAGNLRLRAIWRKEKFDPKARNSSHNAYADGQLIPGFGVFSMIDLNGPGERSDGSALMIRNAPLVSRDRLEADEPKTKCQYGVPVRCDLGVLTYPDFSVRLSERSNWTALKPMQYFDFPSYIFGVFDRGTGANAGGFAFEDKGSFNGRSFEMNGKTYFAEMYYTTAGFPSPSGNFSIAHAGLAAGEIVVWDEGTAAARNRPILAAWSPQMKGDFIRQYANGVALKGMFTGDFFFEAIAARELDEPLRVLQRAPFAYPEELRGSGFIGRVGATIIVDQSGRASEVMVVCGNELRFQFAVGQSLKQWRFAAPMQNGHPVTAFLDFTAVIPDDGSTELNLDTE